ncbi:class II fructose-bisphosphate aldolase [Chloroflexota bacterium]
MVSNNNIDDLIEQAVFNASPEVKSSSRKNIRDLAASSGIYLASIQGLYDAAAQGVYSNKTVPAINVRGLTYLTARAIFKSALKLNVGALIFELARTEMVYTDQPADEYVTAILAGAIKENYKGPVFVQGDHFQFNQKKYAANPQSEIDSFENSTREAIAAGFYNIDIDSSTLVDLSRNGVDAQQEDNYAVAADMTKFVRNLEPKGITVSIGGEIGEVGTTNTTVEELRAYMDGYRKRLGADNKGISKMSVQSGTAHGGIVMADGSIADVQLDFNTIEELGKVAREEYGVGGIVQHGASTLPDDMFELFPKSGTLEVHLATGFQNMVYDCEYFPKDLLTKVYKYLEDTYPGDKKAEDSYEQFIYKTRKKGWGGFKSETWHLPEENLQGISDMLEKQFAFLYEKLNVTDTADLVAKYCGKTD